MGNSSKADSNMPNLPTSQDDLMELLGIDSGQIEEKTTRTRKSSLPLDNRDALRSECNEKITEVVTSQGKKISFTAFKPNGWAKDANGKPLLDANGKKKLNYKRVDVSGTFVIDEIPKKMKDKDGKERTVTFYRVSRPIVYTEAFDIADFTEV